MIHAITTLFRLKLSLLNGVAALAGYLLFPSPVDVLSALVVVASVSLLAAGGSALNQVLERDLDALMLRTRMRPVVQLVLTPRCAAALGTGAILSGLLLLFATGGALPPQMGVAALLWYLAVYTPLKRRTSLALPIGALCGAFPPLIGWTLAGGQPEDFRIITLAGLLFLWQVPHFWLFQRRHEADYRQAGIPLFTLPGSGRVPGAFLWLWIVALCAAALLLPAFGMVPRPLAVWYLLFPLPFVFLAHFRSGNLLFSYINCFPLLVTLLLLLQKQG
jgi:protoheme IX farnesyltransferase